MESITIVLIVVVSIFTYLILGRFLYFIFRSRKAQQEKVEEVIEPPKPEEIRLPFRKRKYLLTISERNFYNVLKKISDENNFILFTKVRLEDLLLPLPWDTENRFGLRNRVKSRHIDFVLCDTENIQPILAIELDDESHMREDRIERDNNINRILNDAGLPILHFKVQFSYDIGVITAQIKSNAIQEPS